MTAIGSVNQIGSLFGPQRDFSQFGVGGRSQIPSQGEMSAQVRSLAESAGYDPAAISKVQEDLQSAMAQVKDGGVEDPRSFMENALKASFEENGIDPEQFKADMQAQAQASGLGRPQGFGGLQSLQSPPQSAAEQQQTLLDQLFGGDDEADKSGTLDIASYLTSQLPAGSLVNKIA